MNSVMVQSLYDSFSLLVKLMIILTIILFASDRLGFLFVEPYLPYRFLISSDIILACIWLALGFHKTKKEYERLFRLGFYFFFICIVGIMLVLDLVSKDNPVF